MKSRLFLSIALLSVLFSGCSYNIAKQDRDVIYQTSTIDALLSGVYDGTVSFGELKKHGDFGIGTVDAVAGEMVALDGRFYRIDKSGHACVISDDMKTPFAAVTFFDPDIVASTDTPMTFDELKARIDKMLPSRNVFYAIRVDGLFSYMKTRTVTRQKKPYPPLMDAIKKQIIFEQHDVRGTLVGLWCPTYISDINVPGYHFHFLTEDRARGGHVLDCTAKDVTISVDTTSKCALVLPETKAFLNAPLAKEREKELEKVEK